MTFDSDKAIERVPRWIAVLGLLGTGVADLLGGAAVAAAFFVGAGAGYFNFRLIERFVNRLGAIALQGSAKPRKQSRGYWLFIAFAIFVSGAFVILRASGFNVTAAFLGFLMCPAAAMIELVCELLIYGHS